MRPRIFLADNDFQECLDRKIKQAIQSRSGRAVREYVVLALQDDGETVTYTTDHVQQFTEGIFASDAEERLRSAHQKSMSGAILDSGSYGMPPARVGQLQLILHSLRSTFCVCFQERFFG